MRVLVACEFSGIVRDAFSRRGHDAWSCDLLPTERLGNHIQGDVLEILDDGWDLMIAHPPCTYLSYAATHVWTQPGRARKRIEAATFFLDLAEAPIERIAIENPMGIMSAVYRQPDQTINPFDFGDSARKRTQLWLKNLPLVVHINEPSLFEAVTAVPPPPLYYCKGSGKAARWVIATHGGHNRSRFWPGIAEAMAEQWGSPQ